MIENKLIPDRAEYFTVEQTLGGRGLDIRFYRSGDAIASGLGYSSVGQLSEMFKTDRPDIAKVCQQIKDRPLSSRIKQPRYVDQNGEDWIDECERLMPWAEFVGAMKFNIGKYLRRLGKKDDELQELEKVADYAERLLQAAKRRIDTHA